MSTATRSSDLRGETDEERRLIAVLTEKGRQGPTKFDDIRAWFLSSRHARAGLDVEYVGGGFRCVGEASADARLAAERDIRRAFSLAMRWLHD